MAGGARKALLRGAQAPFDGRHAEPHPLGDLGYFEPLHTPQHQRNSLLRRQLLELRVDDAKLGRDDWRRSSGDDLVDVDVLMTAQTETNLQASAAQAFARGAHHD